MSKFISTKPKRCNQVASFFVWFTLFLLKVLQTVAIAPWFAKLIGFKAFELSVTANYFFIGWIGEMLYMDKTFDEAMAKRGFANTNIRNEQGR